MATKIDEYQRNTVRRILTYRASQRHHVLQHHLATNAKIHHDDLMEHIQMKKKNRKEQLRRQLHLDLVPLLYPLGDLDLKHAITQLNNHHLARSHS